MVTAGDGSGVGSADEVLSGTDSLVGADALATTDVDEFDGAVDPDVGGAAVFEVQPAAASALATTTTVSLENRDTAPPAT